MSLPKREESSKLMSQAKMELKGKKFKIKQKYLLLFFFKELSSCSPTEKKNN